MSDTQPAGERQWTDEAIGDLAYKLSESIRVDAFGGGERQIREALKQVRDDLTAERTTLQQRIVELEDELARVLDVALARGGQLGYEDDDYHARYKQLTGEEWIDEWEDTE